MSRSISTKPEKNFNIKDYFYVRDECHILSSSMTKHIIYKRRTPLLQFHEKQLTKLLQEKEISFITWDFAMSCEFSFGFWFSIFIQSSSKGSVKSLFFTLKIPPVNQLHCVVCRVKFRDDSVIINYVINFSCQVIKVIKIYYLSFRLIK